MRVLFKFIPFFCLHLLLYSGEWAEHSLEKMSLREKIAHLYALPVWTQGRKCNIDQMEKMLKKEQLGSILFMQGTIESQIQAYARLQKAAHLPLLVGQDNEWGLSLRLKDALRFPRNMMLGALSDSSLIYRLGKEYANQCKGVGVHINFAPVVDVNNNPHNPVINDRSFGEDPELVSEYGLLMMKGMQDHGIMACAKHFPGHGDTHLDSHFSLPCINKSKLALHEIEWKPFQRLIDHNLQSIMTAHLLFPQIEENFPSSLSPKLIQTTLKSELGFDGLVISDSFEMKAISDSYEEGDSDLLALLAGTDIIIRFDHFEKAVSRIEQAVVQGEISEKAIDAKVLRVLEVKEKFNLHQSRAIDPTLDLFSDEAKRLKKRAFREAITLIHDQHILPLNPVDKIAFVQIGRDVIMKDALEIVYAPYEEQCPKGPPPFYTALKKELPIDYFFLPKKAAKQDLTRIVNELSTYNTIVVGVYEMNKFSKKNYGLLKSTFDFLESMKQRKKTICLSLFGSPYCLKHFNTEQVILMCYENDRDAQIGAAEILLGQRKAKGQLPISASDEYPRGFCINQNLEAF